MPTHLFEAPICIEDDTTIKFLAKTETKQSTIQTETYEYAPITVEADIKTGFYLNTINVTLTASQVADIYYTLDGSEPTINSSRYVIPIELPPNFGPTNTYPLYENMDTGSFTTLNTITSTDPEYPWAITNSMIHTSGLPHSGSYVLKFDCWNAEAGKTSTLQMPINLSSASGNVVVGFYIYHDTDYSDCDDRVEVKVGNTSNSQVIGTAHRYIGTENWEYVQFLIPSNYFTGDAWVELKGISAYGVSMYIDDIHIWPQV